MIADTLSTWRAVIIALTAVTLCMTSGTSHGAHLIQVDLDGNSDNAAVTLNPQITFGNGQNTYSISIASSAVGLAPGNSIFGGNGTPADQYRYAYTPGTHPDNVVLAAGTALNDEGSQASGLASGSSGTYAVYATWPFTSSVSGGPTNYTLIDNTGGGTELFSVSIDQNTAGGTGAGAGDEWVLLANALLVSGNSYTLVQTAGNSNFVSMRSAGVLFDVVPEPASLALVGLGAVALMARRRRSI